MYWRYGVRKRIMPDKTLWFDVVEVYVDGSERSWTRDSITPGGESKALLIKELEMMLKDCKKARPFTDPSKVQK